MVRRTLLALCSALLMVCLSSCGQTYKLVSISASPSSGNLFGAGTTQQFVITATYSNTKTAAVTLRSTGQIGTDKDPATNPLFDTSKLTLSSSGKLEVTGPLCTWTATQNTSTGTYSYATDPFVVTFSYTEDGVTAISKSLISVNSSADCYDGVNTSHP
jgi:hypothetical protein